MNTKKSINKLLKAILLLQTEDEAKIFFRDLLTSGELDEFSKRWQAAKMLYEKTSYSIIVKETGLSSTTVARVSKWLHGKSGGYRLVLNRMKHRSSN